MLFKGDGQFSNDILKIVNMSPSSIMPGRWSRLSRINFLANWRLLARAALKAWMRFTGRRSVKKRSQGGMWSASACNTIKNLLGWENAVLMNPLYALYSYSTNLDFTEQSWYYLPSQFMLLSFNGTKTHTKSRCLHVSLRTDTAHNNFTLTNSFHRQALRPFVHVNFDRRITIFGQESLPCLRYLQNPAHQKETPVRELLEINRLPYKHNRRIAV